MNIDESKEYELAELEREYFESSEYMKNRVLEAIGDFKGVLWDNGKVDEIKLLNIAIGLIKLVDREPTTIDDLPF